MFNDNNIIPAALENEMSTSYLNYSMSVIVARAIPDVRDGLKPVHRRILYQMHNAGFFSNRPYKKSARIVGDVLGKYHPHGDTSVYDALARMAQEWSLRYPLVDGQGNFGSIDGDSPAAMRYTEARMAPITHYMLQDIKKDTVDFMPNFDDELLEPVVLPTVLPTLLLNGSSGIAVGMATNLPPHNLSEIVDAIVEYIKNPDITINDIMKVLPGPDFPTGGIIYGYSGVREAYETGRGKIILRAKYHTEETQKQTKIIVTEIPYQVNKSELVKSIAKLKKTTDKDKDPELFKALSMISDLRDESARGNIRIVIELKKDSIPDIVTNQLLKHTQLQVTFGANMLALVKGRPKLLTLKDLLRYFVEHREEIIVRRSKFDLDVAEKRVHILEGFIKALDNLDEVIHIIRHSQNRAEASIRLQERFAFSKEQAEAILDLRMYRLTNMERESIIAEKNELLAKIEKLRFIISNKQEQLRIIVEELLEIKKKFADERRTEIVYNTEDLNNEDFIVNEEVIVTISHNGYIKRIPANTYRQQNKGGKGLKGITTAENDFVEYVFNASTHHHLLFFTDKGKVYKVKVYNLPEGNRNAKGRAIANVINKEDDETVTAYLSTKEFKDDEYVIMCTQNGVIKKTELSLFSNVRTNGIIAISLHEDDKLISAKITNGNNEVILGTRQGFACRFKEEDVRSMGRTAAGVRGIALGKTDKVVAMVILENNDTQLLVVSEKGLGKRTKIEEFRLIKRGGKGVISMNITEKTGKVVRLLPVMDDQDLIVITTGGILIRQDISKIRTIGRNTQGVRLIKLDKGDLIADITTIAHEEKQEENSTMEVQSPSDNLEQPELGD